MYGQHVWFYPQSSDWFGLFVFFVLGHWVSLLRPLGCVTCACIGVGVNPSQLHVHYGMASDLSDKCQHFRTRFSLAAAAVVGLGFWTLFAGSSLIWGQWFISSAMLRLGPLRHSATKLMRSMRWGHISSLVVFAISDLQSFPTVIPKSVQIIPYTFSLHTFWDGH